MQAIELGIKTQKIVYRGEKCYKILSFAYYNFNDERLPKDYFAEFPFCFEDDGQFIIRTNDKSLVKYSVYGENIYCFKVEDYIPKDEFEKILEIVKYCGEKLHNLNIKIREMEKEWNGTEEFKI